MDEHFEQQQQQKRLRNPFSRGDSDSDVDENNYPSAAAPASHFHSRHKRTVSSSKSRSRTRSRSLSSSRKQQQRSRSPGPVQSRKVYTNSQLGLFNAGSKFTGIKLPSTFAATAAATPGGIGEKPPAEYKRVNKDEIDWNEVYEPETTDDPDYNFMSHCGQSISERMKNPDYMKISKIWEENYDMVTPVQNATLVQKHYNEKIRLYNPHAKIWLKKSIYRHFEDDCPTHGVVRRFWLRTLHGMSKTIVNNQLHRIHIESGLEEIDFKCIKPLLGILKEIRPLLNECNRINNVY